MQEQLKIFKGECEMDVVTKDAYKKRVQNECWMKTL